MKKYILNFVAFVISFTASTQNFLNLNFEYGVYRSQPRKWAIEGEGDLYNAWLDSTVAKAGNKSLFISLKKAEVYCFLELPANVIAGKNVQVKGFVKANDSDSLELMLLFHNPVGGKPIAAPIKLEKKEWTLFSHNAFFPQNYSSDRLLIAFMASGSGSFWLDDLKIEIDGKEYGNGPPDFREPTKKEIIDLNKIAVPVRSLALDTDVKDLTPLSKIIGKASIVGLGENSHGSATIYKLKLRMVQYMVKDLGFTIFALETPTVEADRINDYVLYNKGTLSDVIKNLVYPSWQTKEMVDIIEWIKQFNKTTNKKVEFKGFDMQDGMAAFEAVQDFAKTNDSALLTALTELKQLYDKATNGKLPWEQVYQKAKMINDYLASKTAAAYVGVDVTLLQSIKHYMTVFLQSLSFKYKSDETKSRDEYMAENIDWLVKNYKGRKIIVSADNTHVTKVNHKMGGFLSRWYGEKYLVFGFTYNTGYYSAYGTEKYYEVYPSYAGTYEYFFSKAKSKTFFIDTRFTGHIPILNVPAGFRSIGSWPQKTTQFREMDLKKHFDVIAYMEATIQSTPLP
jgi:erythromycin esterase